MLNASSLEFLLRFEWNGKSVFNNPCKSKRGFTELRRDSCVSFDVYWCELWTETRCVIFVSPDVNYCLYACGSATVTFDQYALRTGIQLQFPRYTIIVTMHVTVLQLLFDQYTLCTGIHLHFPDIQLTFYQS